MRGANRDRGEDFAHCLEEQPAGSARKEGPGPRYQAQVDPLGGKHPAEGRGVVIGETTHNVKEERRDFPFIHPDGPDFVCVGVAHVRH